MSTAPKTTKLGTKLTLKVYDFRGQSGFPTGSKGLVYEYRENRTIHCKFSGCEIKRDARYAIRTAAGEEGWRIDLIPRLGPTEAVYGLGESRPTHWTTAKQAAQALSEVLDEIERNSSLGG